MPTLLDRLLEVSDFKVPIRTESENKIPDFPENIALVISRTEQEIIIPNSKKFQLFGHLTQKYYGDRIAKIAQELSRACSQRYPPCFFYVQDRKGFSSLLLDKLDCHAI